ncbi:unnamed protein product [Clonostachys rosea]|uniref:Uncharacterized protein n=1 Tax=Bionectria ochroleuca TaxID=29856 RepID=A0ABY6V3I4_BIOOC|nr:unnamed protein product [Clonostachys rosea]
MTGLSLPFIAQEATSNNADPTSRTSNGYKSIVVAYTSLFLYSCIIDTTSSFQSQCIPLGHRSSRSTPAAGVSPLAVLGEPGGVSVGQLFEDTPKAPKIQNSLPLFLFELQIAKRTPELGLPLA